MPVHNIHDEKLVSYLRQLTLSTDEITAYLYLLAAGPQTVLALSRGLKTGRTKLYPLLEELGAKQLVVIHERHYGTSYQATSPERLSFLVSRQEQISQNLRNGLPAALQSLKDLQQASPATSKIIEYNSLDGIKQMYWNIHQAQTDYYILGLPAIRKGIGKHLSEKLQSVLDDKKLVGHILTNQKNTSYAGLYVSQETFKIEYETYVYNNVVSLLSYEDKNYYGVEIHNQQLAQQYRQLLSALWQQASS